MNSNNSGFPVSSGKSFFALAVVPKNDSFLASLPSMKQFSQHPYVPSPRVPASFLLLLCPSLVHLSLIFRFAKTSVSVFAHHPLSFSFTHRHTHTHTEALLFEHEQKLCRIAKFNDCSFISLFHSKGPIWLFRKESLIYFLLASMGSE